MQFKYLKCFERASWGGGVAPDLLRSLGLPMPEDVLEQFVIDHGLNADFQREYGEIDLHQLAWTEELLTVGEIQQATSKFGEYVDGTRQIFRNVSDLETLANAPIHPEFANHWSTEGTWVRSPVFLNNATESLPGLHLVEGHTRVGMLIGMKEARWMRLADKHSGWVGTLCQAAENQRDWRTILRERPISFYDWLMEHAHSDDPTDYAELAEGLLSAESRIRWHTRVEHSRDGLVELARDQMKRPDFVPEIDRAAANWREDLERIARGPLRASA